MARVKTFANAGTLLPTDLNSIQDDYEQKVNDTRLMAGSTSIDGLTVRRGKSIIAATESRTNVAYGLLTTPDRVQNIVLPTDGLIAVCYQATWQESVVQAGQAAIFIGANQVKGGGGGLSPAVQETYQTTVVGPNVDRSLGSFSGGLATNNLSNIGGYGGDVTTGQIVGQIQQAGISATYMVGGGSQVIAGSMGGPCYIFAAAGTYDVSVQWKASSGSVTAKNRRLWVWSVNF